jgi:hypothetical protein
MRLFLPVAALICVTACRAPSKIVMDTHKKNETLKEYREILITGEGGLQSKMYLQNLTDELNKQLSKSNIHSHYVYLGDSRKLDTDQVFEKAKAGQYDAVIRILPKFSDYQHVNEHFNAFDLTLKEKTDTVIWQASLKTDIDPIAKNIYKGISNKVMDVLAENLIIPAK